VAPIFLPVPIRGVFLSTNNGASWAPVRNGLTDTLVSSLVISGSDIYAGTSNGGAFLSSNNGGNWVAINNGALPGNAHIYSLAASGSSIYAAANSIYVTNNNGGSWTKLNGGPPVPATSVLVVDSTIYVGTYTQGIYVSTNNGASWAAANNGINGVYVKTFGYNGSEVLASVASNDLFITTNQGNSWTAPIDSGLNIQGIDALAAIGSNVFAAAYEYGTFHSPNFGGSWSTTDNGLPQSPFMLSLCTIGAIVFAGPYNYGVYSSNDNATNWVPANNGIHGAGDIVKAMVSAGPVLYAGTSVYGVYMSTDSGANWRDMGLIDTTVLSLAISGSHLYAGTAIGNGGVMVSIDSGANWNTVADGLNNHSVFALAVSDSNLFAGADGDVFVSTNGGNWVAVDSGLPVSQITALAISGSSIFAGTANKGIYLSTNNGVNWKAVNTGLPNLFIGALLISDSTIFAGTGMGVWQRRLADFNCQLASPEITADKNNLCPGDSAQICAPAGFTSYQWNTGDTGSCLHAKQAGNYYVNVIDNGGCTTLSDTVSLSIYQVPVDSIYTDKTIFCSNDSAQLCAPIGYTSYQWNAGVTGTGGFIYVKQAGDYYVMATDSNGCIIASNHLSVSVYPVPSVSITVLGDTLTSFGQVNYQWIYNENTIPGATFAVYIAHQRGNYSVEVTDTDGCTTISNPVFVTGMQDLEEDGSISIYPNPSVGSWQLTMV